MTEFTELWLTVSSDSGSVLLFGGSGGTICRVWYSTGWNCVPVISDFLRFTLRSLSQQWVACGLGMYPVFWDYKLLVTGGTEIKDPAQKRPGESWLCLLIERTITKQSGFYLMLCLFQKTQWSKWAQPTEELSAGKSTLKMWEPVWGAEELLVTAAIHS